MNTIECNFIDSEVGHCFDTQSSVTGVPTPILIAVAASNAGTTAFPTTVSTAAMTVALAPSSAESDPNTIPVPTATETSVQKVQTVSGSRQVSVGAIIGSAIGGLVTLSVILATALQCHRQLKVGSDKPATSEYV